MNETKISAVVTHPTLRSTAKEDLVWSLGSLDPTDEDLGDIVTRLRETAKVRGLWGDQMYLVAEHESGWSTRTGKFLCSFVALMDDGAMESILRNLITAIPKMMNGELA